MSLNDLRQITPYLTIFGIFAALLACMDFVVPDSGKGRIFCGIASAAQIATKPFSFAYYGFVTIASIFLTVAIISIAGLGETNLARTSALVAAKSSGPLIFALVLKILIFDYILAIQAFLLVRILATKNVARWFLERPPLRWTFIVTYISADLYFTGILTAAFLNWWEIFQTLHAPTLAAKVPSGLASKEWTPIQAALMSFGCCCIS